MKLDIPYLKQWGANADASKEDCGPAALAMILAGYGIEKTVDEVFRVTGAKPNSLITFDQLGIASRKCGLNIEHHILSLDTLKQKIKEGFPAVALVNYKYFPNKQDKYNGPHFVVVFGQTANTVFVHDPNRLRGNDYGDTVTIKNEPWKKMWQLTNQEYGNKNNQVLIPTRPLTGEEVEDMDNTENFKQIYRALYGREATQAEIDRWNGSGKSAAVCVAELFASLELGDKLSSLSTQVSSTERAVSELTTTINTKIDNLAVDNGQLRSELESDREIVSGISQKVDTISETGVELTKEYDTVRGLLGGVGERLVKVEEKLTQLLQEPAPSEDNDGEEVKTDGHGILWSWLNSFFGRFSRGNQTVRSSV